MQDSDASNFMKTVEEIELAEQQAEKIKEEARKKAEHVILKGRETALKIKGEREEEMVKAKNKVLKSGKEKIENEVQNIVEKAQDEGERLKRKKLEKDEILSLLKEFLLAL